jgi:hypothetical protein
MHDLHTSRDLEERRERRGFIKHHTRPSGRARRSAEKVASFVDSSQGRAYVGRHSCGRFPAKALITLEIT